MSVIKFRKGWFISLLFLLLHFDAFSQLLAPGTPILDEFSRRQQLINPGKAADPERLAIRPILADAVGLKKTSDSKKKLFEFSVLPLFINQTINTQRPYGWGDFGIPPGRGFQHYLSGGFFASLGFLNLQFQPEVVFAQDKPFQGFSDGFSPAVQRARFHYWNNDDTPETFSDGGYSRFWWGQSSLTASFGAFEIGASTRSIWWGAGQWSSLTFSNNAESFPHFTLNTTRPAKTPIGNFEGQVLVGRLENSGREASQIPQLNDRYFLPFNGDWRYLNALMLSYQPKWVPGLFIGFLRTFQQYDENRGDTFRDYMPIFDAFQKKNFFEDGNTLAFDNEARDQQAVIFLRLVNKEAKAEIYGEYGRRDHSYDWREALMNPEHARAYLMGFQKLFSLKKENKYFQIRGEMTQHQESVNRYIRYEGLGGRTSWATHYQVRGFVNRGQPLGTGIGTGSNSQTLEFSFVEEFDKLGIIVERIANHQDFYYRAFGQQKEVQPWVDLSAGLIFDKRWNNFLLGSKLQLVNGRNYQWQSADNSSPEFPSGNHLLSFHGNLQLVYLWDYKNK
ncbi:MAG: capsule assembly Wzi family protein [Cyclobacterium sp.]|uniref:capsule assembly Wzi family protein n=1 Tax=unclassified Cyclobacterium TaxID=2615055 RepID=UPI0013D4A072|nr:capsule assembly Wzi family protein [Cyclobacterium sp. SYSU L10401]